MIKHVDPSDAILEDLACAMADHIHGIYASDELDEVVEQLVGADIGLIEDYKADTPGYIGPVYIVVWPAGPENVTTFVYYDNGRKKLEVCADTVYRREDVEESS